MIQMTNYTNNEEAKAMNKTFAVLLITLFTLYTTQGYTMTAQVRNTVSQKKQ